MMMAATISKAIFSTFIMLYCLRSICCNQCSLPSVYDISFEFQDNCSLVINWTEPTRCSDQVLRYTVQFAQGCPSHWTNFTVDGNRNSLKIQELGLFTACLLGDCYVRVAAVFARADSEPVISHCVSMGDFFHDPSFRKRYFGRHVCIPIFTMCPENTAPSFFINEDQVSYTDVITNTDTYNLTGNNMLCIFDIISDQVIHETCHIHTNCPGLCPEDFGELTLVSRAEIQLHPTGNNEPSAAEESHCTPSVIMFCPSNSRSANATTVHDICLCLPLYQLQNRSNPKNITVNTELKQPSSAFSVEFSVNGSMDQRLTLNLSLHSQCFQAQFTLLEDQTADECVLQTVSFDLCLNYSSSSTTDNNCVYIPMPCTKIILNRNYRDVCAPTTTESATLSVMVFPKSSDSFHLIIITATVLAVILQSLCW